MSNGPPPVVVMSQFINGMVIARCVTLAADLAIADQLAAGPRDAAALAAATSSNPDALYRVLRTLAGLGVFAEQPDGSFANTPLSELLRSDVPGSLRGIARWLGHPMHWRVVGDLDHSVRTGAPAVNKDTPDVPPYVLMARDPSAQATFNDAMTGASISAAGAIVAAYDFSRFARIVDVGGGHGTVSIAIARAAPAARVTIYDLPHVAEGAHKNIAAAGVEGRVDVAAGSFFEKVPGPADLLVLKYILHLLDDATAIRVLGNCRAALDAGGTILLCELVITPTPDSIPARIMDIEMLIGSGGRERTEAQYAQLLERAGLKLLRVVPTATPLRLLEASVAT